MKNSLLELYVFNRIWLALSLIVGGLAWGFSDSFTYAWILVAIGVILLLAHFFLGPIRILQKAVEKGDMEKAQKIINTVKFPNLLIKPIRSMYYFIQSNMAVSSNDFTKAEQMIQKSTKLGMPMKDMNSMAIFQHGAIAYRKGDNKTAINKLREAISKGMDDNDSLASAHLMLSNIFMQRKDNRTAKIHFKKAKAANPKNGEIKSQIKQIEKYIHRIPG